MTPKQFVAFVLKTFQCKMHPRIAWCGTRGEEKLDNPEHVLGHTGGLSLLVTLVKHIPTVTSDLNMLRCHEMGVVHDILCEWKDGDTNGQHLAETPEAREREERRKLRAERAAVREILETLPTDAGDAFFRLWKEYVAGETPEARLVKQLDKLEFVLTTLLYYLDGQADETLFMEEYLPNSRDRIVDPYLLSVLDEIERIVGAST